MQATDASLTVNAIDLVVDAGYGGTQKVQLSDVFVNGSEYVPGTVGPTVPDTGWVNTNSAPAWIYLHKTTSVNPTRSMRAL